MEITADNLDDLLKKNGLNRNDLATRLKINRTSIDTWMSRKTIPPKRIVEMSKFLIQGKEIQSITQNVISLKINTNDFERLEQIALEGRETLTQCATRALIEFIEEEYQKLVKQDSKINSTKSCNATKSPASTETNPNDSVEAARYTATGLPGLSNTGNAS